MSVDAQAVLREALSLPDDESARTRADIAAELLASLEETAVDEPALVSETWRREIEPRAQRVLDVNTEGHDWHDLRQRLADELAGG